MKIEEFTEKLKSELENLFDGDDTNSNNVIDRISHQMLDDIVDRKIEEAMSLEGTQNK